MRRLLTRDAWGGIGLTLLAALLALEAYRYPFGTLTNAGPGFFPLVFALVLLGLGITMIVESLSAASRRTESNETEEPLAVRSLIFISAAILAFYLILTSYGLVPATVALVMIASFAERDVRPMRLIVMAVVLSIIAVAIFIYGFRLPLQAFNWG